ncbi:MAG: alpha/beta fold hydrolase, partial [Verrucomicrobiales bacterium]|nr:alpha/beta fold hydrolase [Verrucomicrobiales bacterium]
TRYASTVEFLKAKLLAGAARGGGAAPGPSAAAELKWNAGSVRSPDGKPVALLWAAPPGAGPFPVVMFVHGAPGGIGEEGLRGIARSDRWAGFAQRGFLVALADYRGHPQGQPFAVLNGEVNAADDLAALAGHLAALPQCDGKRLAIIGGSLGGMVTLEAVAGGKLAPACVTLNAPATFPFLRLRGRPQAGRELTDADFDKAGALARAGKVSCPVLIVQGAADGLTPLNKQLHALLQEAGGDSRLELFEGEGHGFTNGPESDAYRRALQLTVDFVERHTRPLQTSVAQRGPRGAGPPAKAPSAPAAWAEPKAEPDGMKYRTFASKAAGTEVSYLIYLPPDYETAKAKRYPLFYWLHGRGGSQTAASQLVKRLDPAIRAGKAPPMIVVGINGLKTSSFVDRADGSAPVQTVIVKELIPHVDATYRTIASREGRAIEGFSMGGAGAPKIGFKYPELFGAVSILAGALHDLESYKTRGTAFQDIYGGKDDYYEANNPWKLVELNADKIRGRTAVRIVVGGKDGLLGRNTEFHQLLDKLKIAHDFTVVPDAPHSPSPVFDGLGDQTWKYYAQAFKAGGGESRVALFDGRTLDAWVIRGGKAAYQVEDGAIVGTTVEGSPNTFLCTPHDYRDFELAFEVKCDAALNSGVQVRSHAYAKDTPQPSHPKRIRPAGDVYGPQVEISADGNAGRVYDEARHAKWLDTSPTEKAREAHQPDAWNRYRIVAQRDRVRTWVNGVSVADLRLTEPEDAAGFIGLQIHSLKRGETGPFQVRWRNLHLRELKPDEQTD